MDDRAMVSVSLSPGLKAEFFAAMKRNDATASAILRGYIRQYVDERTDLQVVEERVSILTEQVRRLSVAAGVPME